MKINIFVDKTTLFVLLAVFFTYPTTSYSESYIKDLGSLDSAIQDYNAKIKDAMIGGIPHAQIIKAADVIGQGENTLPGCGSGVEGQKCYDNKQLLVVGFAYSGKLKMTSAGRLFSEIIGGLFPYYNGDQKTLLGDSVLLSKERTDVKKMEAKTFFAKVYTKQFHNKISTLLFLEGHGVKKDLDYKEAGLFLPPDDNCEHPWDKSKLKGVESAAKFAAVEEYSVSSTKLYNDYFNDEYAKSLCDKRLVSYDNLFMVTGGVDLHLFDGLGLIDEAKTGAGNSTNHVVVDSTDGGSDSDIVKVYTEDSRVIKSMNRTNPVSKIEQMLLELRETKCSLDLDGNLQITLNEVYAGHIKQASKSESFAVDDIKKPYQWDTPGSLADDIVGGDKGLTLFKQERDYDYKYRDTKNSSNYAVVFNPDPTTCDHEIPNAELVGARVDGQGNVTGL